MGFLAHSVEDLTANHDWLGSEVGFFDHPFLSNEYLLRRDFHGKIVSHDHDTIRLLQNLIEVVQSFVGLYLRDDSYIGSFLAHELANVLNIAGFPHVGS